MKKITNQSCDEDDHLADSFLYSDVTVLIKEYKSLPSSIYERIQMYEFTCTFANSFNHL